MFSFALMRPSMHPSLARSSHGLGCARLRDWTGRSPASGRAGRNREMHPGAAPLRRQADKVVIGGLAPPMLHHLVWSGLTSTVCSRILENRHALLSNQVVAVLCFSVFRLAGNLGARRGEQMRLWSAARPAGASFDAGTESSLRRRLDIPP